MAKTVIIQIQNLPGRSRKNTGGRSNGVVVELTGYAWLSTFSKEFLEQFSAVPRVIISSDVKLDLGDTFPNLDLSNSKMAGRTSVTGIVQYEK